jgi:hypothetical protein
MKKLVRKFAVINCTGTDRKKILLPMNESAFNHMLSLRNDTYNSEDENCRLALSTISGGWSEQSVRENYKSLVRMSGMNTNVYGHELRSFCVDNSSWSNCQYLRLIDKDVKVTSGFFDFLVERTNLKFLEEGNKKFVIVDDSIIPEGLTESFVEKGKLVKKDCMTEIYGDRAILRYHHSHWHPEIEKQFTKFMDKSPEAVNFGFEAEKSSSEFREEGIAMKLAHETGFKKEEDGSLGEYGFELISPILPLYNQQVIDECIAPVTDFLNAGTSDRCGGHFNISMNGIESRDILKGIKGSLPILYSIYEKRIGNSYCPVRNFSTYLRRRDKYQACYLKNMNVLEIRLFPAIKNVKVLQNRIELMRMVMGNLYGKTAMKVLLELANPTTNIHNFLLNVVLNGDVAKFTEKLRLFAKYSEQYGCGKISLACKKKVNKLMQDVVFHIPVPAPQVTETITEVAEGDNQQEQQSNTEEVSVYSFLQSHELRMASSQVEGWTPANTSDLRLMIDRADDMCNQTSPVFSDFQILAKTLDRFGYLRDDEFSQTFAGATPHELVQAFRNGFIRTSSAGVSDNAIKISFMAFCVLNYIMRKRRTQNHLSGYVNLYNGVMLFLSVEITDTNTLGAFGMEGQGVQWIIDSPQFLQTYNIER